MGLVRVVSCCGTVGKASSFHLPSTMGCTASNPILESGKALVESTKDSAGAAITEGTKTIQDVGEKVKEGISHEIEHVQQTVKSAIDSTGESISSMIGKGESAANEAKNDVKEELQVAADAAEEAVSQAETVLASEVDDAMETIEDAGVELGETVEAARSEVNETLVIEDVDESMENEGKAEDIVQDEQTPSDPPEKADKE